MLFAITSTGKITLLIVAGTFIVFAIVTAILIPARRPDFPGNVAAFSAITAALFIAQLGAVYWVTETQEVEVEHAAGAEGAGEEAGGEESTPAETTPSETTPSETTPGESTPSETMPAAGSGDATAGKAIFTSAGCVACHTLADAGATGSVGPNLDDDKPSFDHVVERVTDGKGVMPPFKGQLTAKQIDDVSAYVSSVAGS